MTAITALTACKKVNRISTEIFVCCRRVLWILTSFQSQCPSILSISIRKILIKPVFREKYDLHRIKMNIFSFGKKY